MQVRAAAAAGGGAARPLASPLLTHLLRLPAPPPPARAVLGLALMTTGTRNLDVDPMMSLLAMHLEEGAAAGPNMKLCAVLGLGLAYAGSAREDVANTLTPFVVDASHAHAFELACAAALALGFIFVGTGKADAASVIADRLMTSSPLEQGSAIARHMALGLGLLCLGQGDAAEAVGEVLAVIEHPVGRVARILVRACAHAGTGDVLVIQELLRECAAHPESEDRERAEKEKEAAANAAAAAAMGVAPGAGAGAGAGASAGAGAAAAAAAGDDAADTKHGAAAAGKYLHQSVAVLGLAIVSMGEELAVDMATRMAGHLLQYGDTSVRRMVPLALGLLHASDPDYAIVDVLARLTHDSNAETAQAAIFALGLVAAGTNNSRVAGLLRTLAVFYKADAPALFVVKLAQGLAHMGKGLLSLNPLHADRQLLAPAALAGLLSAALLFVDVKTSLHGASSKWHILLYTIATAMHPRFVATVGEDGVPLSVDIRVGTAVETVGQAGRPKTITGFQTHTTPVLLGARDRAELVDDAHLPLTTTLEGIVILRKNPRARKQPAAAGAAAARAAADAAK